MGVVTYEDAVAAWPASPHVPAGHNPGGHSHYANPAPHAHCPHCGTAVWPPGTAMATLHDCKALDGAPRA